jgi:hypothetical protein
MRPSAFARVRSLGLALPGTEESTSWNSPSLKREGTLYAVMASHKSAEPDTLVVILPIDQRDDIIAADPRTYYLTEHYVNYPSLLVRLRRVHDDALRDLLLAAWRLAGEKKARKRKRAIRSPRARSAGRRSGRPKL